MVTVDDRTGINEKPTELFYLVLLEINIYIHLRENRSRTHLCHLCVSGPAMWIYTHSQIMRVLIPLISSALVHFQLLAWHSTSRRFVHTMRLAMSRAV